MNNRERHYLQLIEQERIKIRPGLDRHEVAEIEFELRRLKGLLMRYRQSHVKAIS